MNQKNFKNKSEMQIFLSYFKPHRKLFLLDMVCALAIALILTSLNRIDTISNAMELRGFGKNKKRTWYTRRPFERRDFAALGLGVVLLVVSLTVTIKFGRFYNPFI